MQDIVILQRDDLRAELADFFQKEVAPVLSALQLPAQKLESFLTRQEAAQMFGVSLPTLDGWVKSGVVKGYRIGVHVRFKMSEIEASLKVIKSVRHVT